MNNRINLYLLEIIKIGKLLIILMLNEIHIHIYTYKNKIVIKN